MNPTHSMEPPPLPGYGTSLVDRINLYLHFRRHFKMLTQRWLLFLVLLMLGAGAGGWMAWNTPSRFESYSKLMIAPRSRASSVIGVEGGEDPMKFAEAQVLLMTSGQVLNKVSAKIQESRGTSNLLVRPKLEAFPDKGNTFVMKVTATNFLHAQQFAIAWAQEFVEFKRQQKAGMINSTEASTQRDILVYEQRLDRARQVLDDFRKRNNIANVADAGQAAAARLERTKAAYQEFLTELKLYENANAEQLAVHGISEAAAAKSTGTAGEPGGGRGARARESGNAEDIDDTFSLSDVLDGLFFVVRAGRTPMRFARMAVNTIRQRSTPLLGVVVNGISIDTPYYYYTTYYYSAYYHRDADQKPVKN